MMEKDSCCIALTWGQDVKDIMYDEEFEQIDKSHEMYVKNRYAEL